MTLWERKAQKTRGVGVATIVTITVPQAGDFTHPKKGQFRHGMSTAHLRVNIWVTSNSRRAERNSCMF